MNNPYSAPVAETQPALKSNRDEVETSLSHIAKKTFLTWEKLRLVYVGLLAFLTLLLAGSKLFEARVLIMIAEGAIVANICYFAGPIVETYVRWLGYQGTWLRWVLFMLGTLLTAMLVVGMFAVEFLPNQN